jgi:hypothetical protein
MGSLKFMGEFEHVLMFAADDPVTPHFNGIGRGQAHGDGVVMHVQANAQGGSAGGHRSNGFERVRTGCFLRLDRF